MGKSTISMAMFNSKLLVYQRVRDKCYDLWWVCLNEAKTPKWHGFDPVDGMGRRIIFKLQQAPKKKHVSYTYTISGWWFWPSWKIWKSVGIIIPNVWKYKKMFQTTNQILYWTEQSTTL